MKPRGLLDRANQFARRGRPFSRRTLFLLGHMRSYSSVLSHVLGSHPQINGYCETHTKYRTYFDLWKLHRRGRKLTGEAATRDYVLDKMLDEYPQTPRSVGHA